MANKQLKDVLSSPVDVIDNGTRKHWETRQAAIDCYFSAMFSTEGSAKERYTNIYIELKYGNSEVVSDGSKENTNLSGQAMSNGYTLADKAEILALIEANELSIRSENLFNISTGKLAVEDRDIIKALLEQDGWYAAQFLRKYIENDKDLLMAASLGSDGQGEISGRGLAYASEALQDDKDFVLEMLKIDAADFRYVSDRLANDVDVVATALQYAVVDYDFASIKECIGTQLFVDMVQGYQQKSREVQGLDAVISQAEHIRNEQPTLDSPHSSKDDKQRN